MKIMFSDFKKGIVKLKLTSPEDGWYLSQIIEKGDRLTGRTLRKVTLGSEGEKTTHIQKAVFLQITVERVEMDANLVRVSGKITQGPDDIPHGSYHTFTLEQNDECSIEKEQWLSYHKSQLKEAAEATSVVILMCVFDRDEALIAVSRQYGYEVLTRLRGEPEKKEKRALTKAGFYPEIIKALTAYAERFRPQSIILASPAFYKEDLVDMMTDKELKQKIVLATCSSASENAIDEVMKRPETRSVLQQVRIAKETEVVERLLVEIAKDGLVAYGFVQVDQATQAGAVAELLVTDAFIRECREKEKFKELNTILKSVEQARGTIHIISIEHDAGKKLQGLGGIAALLRYKLEW